MVKSEKSGIIRVAVVRIAHCLDWVITSTGLCDMDTTNSIVIARLTITHLH